MNFKYMNNSSNLGLPNPNRRGSVITDGYASDSTVENSSDSSEPYYSHGYDTIRTNRVRSSRVRSSTITTTIYRQSYRSARANSRHIDSRSTRHVSRPVTNTQPTNIQPTDTQPTNIQFMRLIQQLQPTALTNEENKDPVEENKDPAEENNQPMIEENNQPMIEENKEELYSMEERIARMTSNLAEDERKQFSDMMHNEEQKTFVTFPMVRPSTVNLMDITPQTTRTATQLINGLSIGSNGLSIGSNNFMDSQTSQATQADLDNLANVPIQAFDQANSQLLNQVINQTFSQADSANVDSQVGQVNSQSVSRADSQVGQAASQVGQANSQGISQPNSINSIWRFNQVSQEEEKVIFRRPSVLYPPPSWNLAVNANASTLLSSAPPLVSQRYGIYPTGELGIPVPSESAASTCEAKAIVLACVLCSVNQIQTVNFPCMHACFCLECAKPAVANSKCCPICRINYMHVSMMYLQQKDATMKDLPVVGQKREREDDIVENIDDSVEIVMAKEVTAVDGTAESITNLEVKEPVNKRTRTE